jgi:hypothetical protein
METRPYTCTCNNCPQVLEFDPEQSGQPVTCPACGMETTLFLPVQRRVLVEVVGPDDMPRFPVASRSGFVDRCIIAEKTRRLKVCKDCGHYGVAKASAQGSIWIEIVLWLFLLVPGLVYSAWRVSKKGKCCAVCGSFDTLPPASPLAAELVARFGRDPEGLQPTATDRAIWFVKAIALGLLVAFLVLLLVFAGVALLGS